MDRAPRRRNGRLQACDPCRRRKMACDHTQPTCSRCEKRGQAAACIYTVTTEPPSKNSKLRPGGTRSERSLPAPVTSPSSVLDPSPTVPQPASARAQSQSSAALTRSFGNGYLGFTSHSAVFDETRQRLSHLHGTPSTIPSGDAQDSPQGGGLTWTLSSSTMQVCQSIIRALPDLSKVKISPASFSASFTNGWVRVAATRILKTLQAKISASPSDEEILEISKMIHENTMKPISDDLSDPNEWIQQFNGPNLRWESIAVLFTFPELFAANGRTVENDPEKMWSQLSFKQVVLECIDQCVNLAMYQTGGNLLLLWVCYRRTFLESITLGDAGLHCLRSHADCVSISLFLGLHVEQPTPHYKPTFCSQLKRLLLHRVFVIDKVISSFQGRPPLLSGRYIMTPLPLDISDRHFFSGKGDLDAAIQSLDENGWNTNGEVASITITRARAELGYNREKIIEIALGNGRDVNIDTLLNIKAHDLAVLSSFPSALLYNPKDIDNANFDVDVVYGKILVRVEHLQNMFFIERLLLRYSYPDEGDLLVVSYDMVTTTLGIWIHKDKFAGIRRDFEWLVMAYAAPGGGILCMELLKPTFSGSHLKNPKITRSSIIQQLSLLVGFLDWVGPDAPNRDLCSNCSNVIQHVLDLTLNNFGTPTNNDSIDVLGQFDSTQMNFNFNLLDTFDWLRTDEFTGDQ
ncbi:unnamed protein product [Clonostachys rosea f. rosea IK726]|uniref:Zn(2)-C6 fungal-type domain-containing protein n=2 Tax=Bionectria ochroleuca TaxID=29856 RepID=A0A0B7JMZ0_BIOOC|nr:unnamed protein product [Clonostachys rosea f. rosea IK726]